MAGMVQLTVESDLDTVALVARAVRALCQDRLTEDEQDAVELALVEAVTNVIQHGYKGRSSEHLTIGVSVLSDRVVIEIGDTAPPMDAKLLTDEGQDAQPFDADDIDALPEGGMGLALIRATMDDVDYRSEGDRNVLKMTKRLAPR